jgi:hypothetical protein
MPKFEVIVEREVPSFRERAVVIVEAENLQEVESYFDIDSLDEEDIEWEEVEEGHGGFPCDYSIYSIENADNTIEADIQLKD